MSGCSNAPAETSIVVKFFKVSKQTASGSGCGDGIDDGNGCVGDTVVLGKAEGCTDGAIVVVGDDEGVSVGENDTVGKDDAIMVGEGDFGPSDGERVGSAVGSGVPSPCYRWIKHTCRVRKSISHRRKKCFHSKNLPPE